MESGGDMIILLSPNHAKSKQHLRQFRSWARVAWPDAEVSLAELSSAELGSTELNSRLISGLSLADLGFTQRWLAALSG